MIDNKINVPMNSIKGKDKWPWVGQVNSSIYNSRNHWPKISIVTPTLNQGQFIEETILSILNQNYPNIEYIVIDGGSNDQTLDILKKYSTSITYWKSESDSGQADAINKGLSQCTGDIFNWINSDDLLAPTALYQIAKNFIENECDLVAGSVLDDFDNSLSLRKVTKNSNIGILNSLKINPNTYSYHQPGIWMKKKNMDLLQPFNSGLHYYFDLEYTLRYLTYFKKVFYESMILVHFRAHLGSKSFSVSNTYSEEFISCYRSYYNSLSPKNKLRQKAYYKYRTIAWHDYLLKKLSGRSKASQILFIVKNIMKNPYYHTTRLTIGQLRLILLNGRFLKK